MKKIVLLAAAAASTTSLAAVTSNSLELKTSLGSVENAGYAETDSTLTFNPATGMPSDRATWIQHGTITEGFGYHFEVNFLGENIGLVPKHVNAFMTTGMHTFTLGSKDNKVAGAEYAFQPEIERTVASAVFKTWDQYNTRLVGAYYTLAGENWGSFTVGAHQNSPQNAVPTGKTDALGYYADFNGSFLNNTLMPIVQFQMFNNVNATDKDFAITGLSAGILWKAAFGMDLAFTYNTLTTGKDSPAVTGDKDRVASSMVLNFEYTINAFRPYFTWISDVNDDNAEGDAQVTTTTMDFGLLYDLNDKVAVQVDYNMSETDSDLVFTETKSEWSIGLNAFIM
jgi:hypothetical protein